MLQEPEMAIHRILMGKTKVKPAVFDGLKIQFLSILLFRKLILAGFE